MPTKAQIIKEVRDSIKKWNPPTGDFEMEISETDVRKWKGQWWVPIYPTRQPKRNYHFIDSLAEVETELQLEKHLKIEIVPDLLRHK